MPKDKKGGAGSELYRFIQLSRCNGIFLSRVKSIDLQLVSL